MNVSNLQNMSPVNTNLLDEFENAFQSCLAAFSSQEFFNVSDQEEVKTSGEMILTRFLDAGKELECHFLQKRMLFAHHKPEQVTKEDCDQLRAEIRSKDILIQKHCDKLQQWQILLGRGGQPGGAFLGQSQTSHPTSTPNMSLPVPAATPTSIPLASPVQHHIVPSTIMQSMQQQKQSLPTSQVATNMLPPHGISSFSQGPLAYLEQTTSNIGMNEMR